MKKQRMKILCPINKLEEARPLIKAGADEFYCGLLLGQHRTSCTRTADPKLDSMTFDELKELIAIARGENKEVFLAFNRTIYSPEEWRELKKNVTKIKKLDLAGVIAANLDLLAEFKGSKFKLAASSFFEAKNHETVQALKEFGAQRIIFDRQIDLVDLGVVSIFPELEFEAFIMMGACRSLANYCQGIVPKNGRIGHLCQNKFFVSEANKLSGDKKEIITARLSMPNHFMCCGACALRQFAQHNIVSLKIVGRGFPLEIKIKSVRMVKAALDLLEKKHSQWKFQEKTKEVFKEIYGVECRENYCYYPHLNL